jgi:outer membrane receptor for ferrienterochelin and colicins
MKKLFTFFLLLLCFSAFAQRTVTGVVTDENGETMPGVIITEKGTTNGTVSDAVGQYSLSVAADATTLVFQFIGYKESEVKISSNNRVDLQLKTSTIDLNPVVISASRKEEKVMSAPAAVSVITAREINSRVYTNPAEYVAGVSGVDIIRTGIATNNVVTRGFNDIFSTSLMTLMDYRIASIPSLRVNVSILVPVNNHDIERVEILKGPASAMYGPNSANGVIHYITRSPLDIEKDVETNINFTAGERDIFGGHFRTAMKLKKASEKSPVQIGFKLSGNFVQGHDWKYNDPEEPQKAVFGKQTTNGRVPYYANGEEVPADSIAAGATGDTVSNGRNNFLRNYSTDARLDFRFTPKTEFILSGGFSSATGIELTGLGAAQVKNWSYWYTQARFRHKNLFVQAYMNSSNAGGTYLLRSADYIVDKSKFYVGQVQHSHQFGEKLRFIYGADVLITNPDTKGTINGRYENKDNFLEYGAYVQGEWSISKVLKFFASGRIDKNSFVDAPFVSPRAALVIKPDARNNIRLSFNRAFTSPSALNTSLDVLNTKDAFGYTSILGNGFGIDGRGIGNRDGFIFSHDNAGTLQFRSPFTSLVNPNGTNADYWSLNNSAFNNAALQPVGQIVAANMIAQGVPSALANIIAAELYNPNGNATIGNNLIMLDLDKQAFLPENAMQPQDIKDIPKVKNQSTITYEIGYSGIIKERIMLTIDVYRSDISDFVSALKLQTPSVFFNYTDILPLFQQRIDSSNTPNFEQILNFVFDNTTNGGNGNGTAADEIAKLTSGVPIGTVSPTVGTDPSLMLTFGNFGHITVYGFDIGAKYYVTENLRLGATYSFVNKNEFETQGYIIPLNAPRHKVNLSVQYDWKKTGLDLGLRWRWQDAFPGNSGVYVGKINAINQIDGTITYTLPFLKTMKVNVTVTNLLNNSIQEFVGAPYMGRLTMGRLSYTF